jgi:NAD(P)-dependent dehydrogenase (short-subunit alcohol dehydrogenase family)
MSKIWFITGISSGFGRAFVEEVVKTGDFVIGTMRKDAQIEKFNSQYGGKAKAVKLDVTDADRVKTVIDDIVIAHKRIDVLVNNAGYGFLGAVEEINTDEVRTQMETNFYGALHVTQAALPHMRKARAGTIVQISSVAGFRADPGFGAYNASKFALEGLSEALAEEVAPFGIKVLLVEPGPFRTEFSGQSLHRAKRLIEDYAETAHARIDWIASMSGQQAGDPHKAARVIMQAVAGQTPLRLPLGRMAIERIRAKLASMEKEIAAWEKAAIDTNCNDAAA